MAFDTETTERFIYEVEQRPAIWDSRCDEYSNKILKTRAWEELCQLFVPDFDEMDAAEKNVAATDLQRKWKSFRDSFRRELGRAKKSTNPGRKEYVYFKQLSFLFPLTGVIEEQLEGSNSCDNLLVSRVSPPPWPHEKKKRISAPEDYHLFKSLVKNLDKKPQEKKVEEEGDKHFLLGLLPHFRSLPESLKLEVQGEFINVLQKYKKKAASIEEPTSHQKSRRSK